MNLSFPANFRRLEESFPKFSRVRAFSPSPDTPRPSNCARAARDSTSRCGHAARDDEPFLREKLKIRAGLSFFIFFFGGGGAAPPARGAGAAPLFFIFFARGKTLFFFF